MAHFGSRVRNTIDDMLAVPRLPPDEAQAGTQRRKHFCAFMYSKCYVALYAARVDTTLFACVCPERAFPPPV